ncbi:Uncharacterised protein [Streptococcus pneumoniae]|nr:Uncharacterised protein [Streptococcus pneumoniae]
MIVTAIVSTKQTRTSMILLKKMHVKQPNVSEITTIIGIVF